MERFYGFVKLYVITQIRFCAKKACINKGSRADLFSKAPPPQSANFLMLRKFVPHKLLCYSFFVRKGGGGGLP